VALPAHDGVAVPSDDVLRWMAETATHLNRLLHSGGHWIVASSDAGEPVLLWRDGDEAMRAAAELAAKAEALPAYSVERVMQFAADTLVEVRRQEAEASARLVKKARARRYHPLEAQRGGRAAGCPARGRPAPFPTRRGARQVLRRGRCSYPALPTHCPCIGQSQRS
jgi:hypothetical protein